MICNFTIQFLLRGRGVSFNRLIPQSDLQQISPYNITPESHINVTRIREMITKRLLIGIHILLVSAIGNREREQYGEYSY